ncbi:MAG TPA: GNAT family N-acetyltransferase [Mucilaginibacter sp.]
MALNNFRITRVAPDQADALLDFSRTTFFDFFGPVNEPANMDAYAAVAFTPEKMLSELTNPDSAFYFATLDGEIAGYLKLNYNNAQTEFRDSNALEVERIYVSRQYHKKNIGKELLHFATNKAIENNFEYIWLGVWEHNHNAIGFYQHHGFEIFSSHEFMLGDDRQTDLLMKKILK